MKPTSAGLLLYRMNGSVLELLIGHMGGPYWVRKHEHAWSIPKGLSEEGESGDLAVAEREFREEVGIPPPDGPTISLGENRTSRKLFRIWARKADLRLDGFRSNEFEMEWPRGSGMTKSFPEIDKIAWVPIAEARKLLVKNQSVFLDRLEEALEASGVAYSEGHGDTEPTLF